jgi:hypothetical protein
MGHRPGGARLAGDHAEHDQGNPRLRTGGISATHGPMSRARPGTSTGSAPCPPLHPPQRKPGARLPVGWRSSA